MRKQAQLYLTLNTSLSNFTALKHHKRIKVLIRTRKFLKYNRHLRAGLPVPQFNNTLHITGLWRTLRNSNPIYNKKCGPRIKSKFSSNTRNSLRTVNIMRNIKILQKKCKLFEENYTRVEVPSLSLFRNTLINLKFISSILTFNIKMFREH